MADKKYTLKHETCLLHCAIMLQVLAGRNNQHVHWSIKMKHFSTQELKTCAQ